MIATGISLWVFQVPAAVFLSRTVQPATLGIWLAIAAGNVIHALLITGRFRGGAWMRREV